MIKIDKTLIALLLFVITTQAQQTNSLLSNIGLGTQFSEATISQRALGGLSVVDNTIVNTISVANPSLLSQLRLTSFGVEVQARGGKVSQGDFSYNHSASSFSNLFIGIPLGKFGAVAGGIRAHSAVGYTVSSESLYLKADGGVNQIYGAYGVKVYKGLSLGVQASYYLGKTDRFRATRSQLAAVDNEAYNVSGYSYKFGLDYKYTINDKLTAFAGTYTQFENTISASGSKFFYLGIETFEDNFIPRRPSEIEETKISGTYTSPMKNVLGLGLGQNEKWFVGLSYLRQSAQKYTGTAFQQSFEGDLGIGFENKSEYKFGGYFIPKKYSIKNYLERITYKVGAAYKNTGLTLNNNSVKDMSLTFGFGMPVGKRASLLNFSMELGKLGDASKNNYQEEYLNLGLSFTLADKWFKKRVID